MPFELSSEEIAQFAEKGFLGPYTLLDPDTAVRAGQRLADEVITTRSWTYAHTESTLPKALFVRERHLDSPIAYRLVSDAAIVDRVRCLLGNDLLLWRSDIFDQGPSDPPTRQHQDIDFRAMRPTPLIVGPSGELPLTVGAWIALTKTTADRGALFVVPGSNKKGFIPLVVKPDAAFGNPGRFSDEDEYPEDQHHVLEMEAGQFILFSNMTVHGSRPSSTRRIAINGRFLPPDVRIHQDAKVNGQSMDLSRHGSIIVSGRGDAGRNVLVGPPRCRYTRSLLDEDALCDVSDAPVGVAR